MFASLSSDSPCLLQIYGPILETKKSLSSSLHSSQNPKKVTMKKFRGFKIRKSFIRVTRWLLRKTRPYSGYHRLNRPPPPSSSPQSKPISKLLNWGRHLTTGVKTICAAKSGSGCSPASVPKGHLAVYVGKKDGDFHRVLVPVIYFNHPLFGDLLREAEEEFGFQHQGGITIPCPVSEFQRVQTRIAAGCGARKQPWKLYY